MAIAHRKDATSEVLSLYGGSGSLTAGGSGDNTNINGIVIDRLGYDSLKVAIGYEATIGASETLTIKDIDIREGSETDVSDGTWTEAIADTTVLSATGNGTTHVDIDLSAYGRYVQVRFTPDLSRAATDTAKVALHYVLGGKSNGLPA